MINLKYPQKEYIEEKLIHLSSKEILEYIEDNKEAELFIIHGIIYYNNLDKIEEVLNKLETKKDKYKKYLFFVSEMGLGLDKFKYFLSKINKVNLSLAYDIITEEKETSSYDCIKCLINSNKISYSRIMYKNIDFVNNLFLYDIEETFEAIKENKFIMNILLHNIEEMEEANEIKKYLIKNKIEVF